ncbi:hypothetical protein [Mycobacteroides abscessus]|uniref:hypothetical protein n=1 Tax=Mycobacteroides abscessus TaxID=36809 RepID=UPI0009C9036B|nr:hypothetical protein [Mycobacteroides abscessus]SLH37960.1 Uncharacterised protein [Mycobacteroides abscessus subsp. massiliense]
MTNWSLLGSLVAAAIVEGTGWRNATRKASRFGPFCQQMALFPKPPRGFASVAWEASIAGIGVWVRDGEDVTEAVRAQPYVRRFWKTAGWEFQETAYRTHLKAVSQILPVVGTPHLVERERLAPYVG